MISILIPTYNYPCYELVNALQKQAREYNLTFEVIVADDHSEEEMKVDNRQINSLEACRYVELEQNLGIARIRNYLADLSRYEYLLFLDSDTMPTSHTFLRDYLRAANKKGVVCGGLKMRRIKPEANRTLRYYYGLHTEEKSAAVREEHPYTQFSSASFLIDRASFMAVRFNESFTQYGHEDTLFGKELEERGINLLHIDCPIYHDGIDTNEEFINKTHRSIENLIKNAERLNSHARLLSAYQKMKKMGLCPLLAFFFRIGKRAMKSNLTGLHPSMKLFALYKLGYISQYGY